MIERTVSRAGRLANYRGNMVEIACPKCGRHGRLSKRRLVDEHGGDIALPDLLAHLAADCARRGSMHDPCQARYVGLN